MQHFSRRYLELRWPSSLLRWLLLSDGVDLRLQLRGDGFNGLCSALLREEVASEDVELIVGDFI